MPCCPSLTVKMQNQVAEAIQAPYEQLKDELGKQDQLFMMNRRPNRRIRKLGCGRQSPRCLRCSRFSPAAKVMRYRNFGRFISWDYQL